MWMATTSDRRAGRTRRPLERIYRIHELVMRKHYPNCRTIAEELEVTPKTIQRDISFMRDELDLPLAYHEREHGYFYEKPVQEFPFLKTTVEDVVALFLARRALEPLSGTPLEASLRESFRRLTRALPGRFSFPWSDLDEAFSVRSSGTVRADASLLEKLANAVLECREIRFDYRKLQGDGWEPRALRPFHLADIDGGWYVIGHDPMRKAQRTFAVQRLRGLRVLQSRFARPPDFRLEEHLEGSFGVWKKSPRAGAPKAKRQLVRLRFSGWAARTVPERRWHPSQEIRQLADDPPEIEMRLELDCFEDVTRWILSWGRQVIVEEPAGLQQSVVDELRGAAAQYEST